MSMRSVVSDSASVAVGAAEIEPGAAADGVRVTSGEASSVDRSVNEPTVVLAGSAYP